MIDDVDIDNIFISNKVSFGKKGYKYFIGYKDDDYNIKPLYIMLPKMSGYVKRFDICLSDKFDAFGKEDSKEEEDKE